MLKTKISILTVTYGDRFRFLCQVLDACKKENPFEIIIVDNGSKNNQQIEEYINNHNQSNFFYIRLDKNLGSAGGFYHGIQRFSQTDSDFLIILDDDNKPEEDFINKYLSELYHIQQQSKHQDVIISGYRSGILASKEVFKEYIKLDNSFFAFSIFSKTIFLKIIKNFLPLLYKEKIYKDNYIQQRYFAFGGTMINRDFVNKIGLPDTSYILYSDDFDYAMRGSNLGYKYFLTKSIIIEDLDITFNSNKPHFLFADNIKNYQIFMPIRNFIIAARRHEVNNQIVFLLNIIIWFLGIFLLVCVRRKFLLKNSDLKKFFLILRAFYRGYREDFNIPKDIILPK